MATARRVSQKLTADALQTDADHVCHWLRRWLWATYQLVLDPTPAGCYSIKTICPDGDLRQPFFAPFHGFLTTEMLVSIDTSVNCKLLRSFDEITERVAVANYYRIILNLFNL